MKPAVLFDLGNTLAGYYRADQFGPVLEAAIGGVLETLEARKLARPTLAAAMTAALAEDKEAADHRFTPMADRLERIFGLSLAHDAALADALCTRFLRPIFALGRVYDDSLPVLAELRAAGHPTAIVSNAPWGSPPQLWREEVSRLGLASSVDGVVLCGDVGWRKPARQIFEHAARELGRAPGDCVFVGDDLRWDVAGSAAAGMWPVLIDREGRHADHAGDRIGALHGVLAVLGLNREQGPNA